MDAGYLAYLYDDEGDLLPELLLGRDAFLDWLEAGRLRAGERTPHHEVVVAARQSILRQSRNRPVSVSLQDCTVNVPERRAGMSSVLRSATKPFHRAANMFSEKPMHPLLSGINAKAELGEMVLVLAPPGSGVTSLLKVISGAREAGMQLGGGLTYNGVPHGDVTLKACYAGEEDDHLPSLSVERTFKIASELSVEKGVPDRPLRVQQRIDSMLKALGLEGSRNTVVGNALLRGVSGGEKKRVSIGEALLMQGAITVLDGWSRGLDSATAMRIGQLLRALTNISGTPCISALYQASPNLYALYDKVLVLRKGKQLFFGTPHDALQYTLSLSLQRPLTQTVPDFLSNLHDPQELSLEDAWESSSRLDILREELAFADRVADALEVGFGAAGRGGGKGVGRRGGASERTRLLDSESESSFDRAVTAASDPLRELTPRVKYNMFLSYSPALLQRDADFFPSDAQLRDASFGIKSYTHGTGGLIATGFLHSLFWLLWREFHLTKADIRQYIVARTGRYIFQGLILGLLYFHLKMDLFGAYNREGLLAASANLVGTGSFVLIPAVLEQRSVFYRHKKAHLFRPSAWPLSKALFDIPLNLMEAVCFVSVFYFMSSMNTDPWVKFLHCTLFFFVFNMTMCNYTRLFVLLSKDLAASQGLAGTSVIVFAFFNGFAIPYDKIPVWWKWAYLISPFSYMYEAVMLNEYDGLHITCDNPILREECERITGAMFIKETLGITDAESHKWMCLVMMLVFNTAALLLCSLCATYIDFTPHKSVAYKPDAAAGTPPPAPTSDTAVAEQQAGTAPRQNSTSIGPGFLSRTPSPAPESGGLEEGTMVWSGVKYTITKKEGFLARRRAAWKRGSVGSGAAAVARLGDSDPLLNAVAATRDSHLYHQPRRENGKVLLRDINGFCKPGMLTALMGSTGAGKTTLLDVLAQRKTVGTQEGEILLDGAKLDPHVIRDQTGYVEQNDLHHPRTTVREAVRFSATLRGADIAAADEMITLLGLEDDAEAMVGGSTALNTDGGVSLVTLKRLTIAVELVSNPVVLFLDEPTSGLDSEGALTVMQSIRSIADTGRSVVCTIHQPSSEIFSLFDSILLLHQGSMVYYGQTGVNSETVMSYFKGHLESALPQLQGSLHEEAVVQKQIRDIAASLEGRVNPADVLMSIINSGPAGRRAVGVGSGILAPGSAAYEEDEESFATNPSLVGRAGEGAAGGALLHGNPNEIVDWIAAWSASEQSYTLGVEIDQILLKMGEADVSKADAPPRRRKQPPIWTVFWTVYTRCANILLRSPTYVYSKLMFTLSISLLFGTTYWQLGDSTKDMRNYVTLVYVCGNMSLICAMAAVAPILEGRPSFYREVTGGTYPAWVAAVAHVITEIPLVVVTSLIWIMILFWGAGFPVSAFGYFALQYFALSFFMQFFGMATAAVVPTFFMAQIILPFVNMLWSLHSGFIILTKSIPDYLIEFHYANPLTYFLRSMVANVITKKSAFMEEVSEIVDPTNKTCELPLPNCHNVMPSEDCVCSAPYIDPTGIACLELPDFCQMQEDLCECAAFSRGSVLLNFYGWSYDTRWKDAAALWGGAGIFLVLFIVGLVKVRHIRR